MLKFFFLDHTDHGENISVFAFMVLRSGNRARDCGNKVQRYRCDSGKELLFAYRATRSDFVFDM